MSTFEAIAAVKVIVVFPDSGCRPVHLRVGKPCRLDDLDWVCPVAAEGLCDRLSPLHGIDSWHVLMVALRYLKERLKVEVKQGAVLHWPDGSQAIDVDEFFVQGNIDSRGESLEQ